MRSHDNLIYFLKPTDEFRKGNEPSHETDQKQKGKEISINLYTVILIPDDRETK